MKQHLQHYQRMLLLQFLVSPGTHAAFKAAYLLRTSNIMSGAYKASFTGTLVQIK